MARSAITLLLALMAVPWVASCSARMVAAPGGGPPSPYGPVNQASRGGTVKYLNQGIAPVRNARREDAYRQMYNACGGYYRIDSEGPHSEGGRVVRDGSGGVDVESYEYWYIQFSCVAPPPARTY